MASNPMQRKARNSFLLGMVITLIITGTVIGFLVYQITEIKRAEKEEKLAMRTVYVISQDIESGQVITPDMLTTQKINSTVVPNNAINNIEIFENYALTDKEGDELYTKVQDSVATLYINKNGREYEVKKDEKTGNYYITVNNNQQTLELVEHPLVAKVKMKKNTVLTTELLGRENEMQDDTRREEYNIVSLPIDLATGDFIDIRLTLPTGENYIVISKKEVELPIIDGVESLDTIWLDLNEDEILTMSSAIVDAYQVPGSKIYATKYKEAGMQEAATPTYPVKTSILALINGNPNVVNTARDALWARYNATDAQGNKTQVNQRQNVLDAAINKEGDQVLSNVQSKVEESITNTKATRKTYLESMEVTE